MAKFDFQDLARVCLHHASSLVPEICPGGKQTGNEWTCASVNGGVGTSCKVNMNTGKWADFASGEKGVDIISLYAASYGIDQMKAARELADKLHYKIDNTRYYNKGTPRTPQKPAIKEDERIEKKHQFGPIPDTVMQPAFFNAELGPATGVWTYLSETGERLFWTVRYDRNDGSKEFRPYSWDEISSQVVPYGWKENVPLYGLEQLALRPEAPILIVEGEKAAEAAKKFIAKYIVMSWMGGVPGWRKADWSVLFGRKILIWPDNDLKVAKNETESKKYGVPVGERWPVDQQPGMSAALGIAKVLAPHGEVKILAVHEDKTVGESNGFDAADALEMGWKWEDFLEFAKPLVRKYIPQMEVVPPEKQDVMNDFVQGSAFQVCNDARLDLDGNAKPLVTMSNVRKMLEFHPVWKDKIWFDNFHLKILTNWRTSSVVEWADLDDLKVCEIFQREFKMAKMTPTIVRAGIQLYAHDHQRNEPREWITSQKWDGSPRVREFFIRAFGTKDTTYTRQASQNFWIAMVARVMEPGIKFDHMVILEGEQGKQKSSALQAIAGKWFGESTEHITSKDFAMCLQGKMIIEIAELSAFSAAEVEAVKKVITIQTDRFRPPYGHSMVTYPRTSVFVGTTNKDDYLQDPTGARRFWPIRISNIDIEYIKENRAQIFAEALSLFKEGIPYWMMPEEETRREQEARRDVDFYEEIIKDWIEGSMHDQPAIESKKIYGHLGFDVDKVNKIIQNRIGKVMRTLGWEYKLHRSAIGIKKMWLKRDTSNYN